MFCNFITRQQYRCFPMKFANLLRMPVLKNIYERLLLNFKDNFSIEFDFYNLNPITCLLHIGWTLFFSIPKIHVTNLLFNGVIWICFFNVLLLYCIYCQPICSLHIYILGEYLQFVYLRTLGFIRTLKNASNLLQFNQGTKNSDILLRSHSPLVPTI